MKRLAELHGGKRSARTPDHSRCHLTMDQDPHAAELDLQSTQLGQHLAAAAEARARSLPAPARSLPAGHSVAARGAT